MWILLIVVLFLVVMFWSRKECMTGKEVYDKTGGSMDMSYTAFKKKLPEAHIVNYHDLRDLYHKDNFTPESINKVI